MKLSAKIAAAKILIVDDESGIRESLSDFMEDEGYEVCTAKSGSEALTKADQFLPDLVMLDIILPDLDGVSVYETLRSKKIFSDIPVVFFSTLGKEAIPPAFMKRTGGAAYSLVRKPVNAELLVREVKKLLKGKKS